MAIDLSRLPLPDAIEALSFEDLYSAFITRFKTVWEAARAANAQLPPYDVEVLEFDPVVIIGQAWSYLRLLDRSRVNDIVRAVLASSAQGADLDNVVARQGIERLVVVPASGDTPAVMESDAALLRRYLLSFERPSAGSRNRYLYEAWTAWPGMHDARVNGWKEHGRRGDTDIVIIGPDGRLATDEEIGLVRTAVTHPSVYPEAVAVTVMNARREEYAVHLMIEVPQGPDKDLIRGDVEERVRLAAATRCVIGGEIPVGLFLGAAYGSNVLVAVDLEPVVIAPDPYTIPVMTSCEVTVVVRT